MLVAGPSRRTAAALLAQASRRTRTRMSKHIIYTSGAALCLRAVVSCSGLQSYRIAERGCGPLCGAVVCCGRRAAWAGVGG